MYSHERTILLVEAKIIIVDTSVINVNAAPLRGSGVNTFDFHSFEGTILLPGRTTGSGCETVTD